MPSGNIGVRKTERVVAVSRERNRLKAAIDDKIRAGDWVLGNFPKQSQDALISLTWLEQAKQRELRADQQQCHLTAGIDVAGPGEDETVLAIRQ